MSARIRNHDETIPQSCVAYWRDRRVWDRWVVEEHEVANRAEHKQQRERTISEIQALSPRPVRIIDLCCGTGRVTYDLLGLAHAVSVVAADVSPAALTLLRTRLHDRINDSRLTIRQVDVMHDLDTTRLGRFDVVVCLDALHHLWSLDKALEQIESLLTPGGLLIGNYFAREEVADHVIRKKGKWAFWRDYWLARVFRGLRWFPLLWRFAGQRGLVRMTFLPADEVVSRVRNRFQVLRVVQSDYLWFVAHPATADAGPPNP